MGIEMSCLKSANLEDFKIHKAAADGDLKTLKKLVKNLDDKNPPIGKVLLMLCNR